MAAISARSQGVDGYLRRINTWKLSRIELRGEAIESPGMFALVSQGITRVV